MTSPSSQLPDDVPAWELVFRFTSSRLCLAFCATVGERWRRSFERLRDPRDLARWVREAGLAGDEFLVTQRVLGEARSLREAIYRSVRAGMDARSPAEADRDLLNRWACRPGLAPQLGANGTLSTWAGPSPIRACLSTVARDAVHLVASPDIRRVRECAAPDCALLFLDRSRPGRRRWCADNACSAKSRSAEYRQRKKASAVARQ